MMDEQANQTSKLPKIKSYSTDDVGVFECRYESPFRTRISFDRPLLRLVVKGTYKQVSPGFNEETCPIFTLLFQPAGMVYEEEYEAYSHHLVIELRSRLCDSQNLNKIRAPFVLYNIEALELISSLWWNIRRNNTPLQNMELRCRRLASLVAEEKIKSDTRPAAVEETLKSFHLQFRQLGMRFDKTIKTLNRGVCHTTTLFSRHEGYSPGVYRARLRVEYARFLLLNDRLRLDVISQMAGFCDQPRFTRTFKKEVGFPPSTYLDRMIQGDNPLAKSSPPQQQKLAPTSIPVNPDQHVGRLPISARIPQNLMTGRISSFPDPVLR